MSLCGAKTSDLMSNFIGIVVRDVGENLKLVKSLTNAIFVCINPNLKPMQLRGPSPNGRKAIG